MAKSILLSIKPKYVSLILNKIKTIEIRKRFPADYVGWVYIYCTKEEGLYVSAAGRRFGTYKDFLYFDKEKAYDRSGKVVARFYCDKVDDYVNGCKWSWETGSPMWGASNGYECILKDACLTDDELRNYVDDLSFYAIHITKLEIFDKPKELLEFRYSVSLKKCKKCSYKKYYGRNPCLEIETLAKAPQNFCYIEGE